MIEAVKELNKVPGFDPLKLMRELNEEGADKPKWYLDVKYRILWFRLCNPLGKIATEIIKLTEQVAVVEAKIYLDREEVGVLGRIHPSYKKDEIYLAELSMTKL